MQEEKKQKAEERQRMHDDNDVLIRIFTYDLPGKKNVYTALTLMKGVSWAISNALCLSIGLDKNKKISELSKEEIAKIEEFLNEPQIPDFMKNRRIDPETGEAKHLYGTDLDLKKEFDIKKMRKIKSYKGMRHAAGQPVRGQKTRSHFRTKGKAVGVKRKAK